MVHYSVYSCDNKYIIRYGPLRTLAKPSIKLAFEQIFKSQGFVTSVITIDHQLATLLFSYNSYQDAVDNYPEYFI